MTKLDLLRQEIYRDQETQRICDLIVGAAVEGGSSDIHIEPLSSVVRIRFRVDGVLREMIEYQPFLHPQIVSRYKILANLKTDESRRPQDGRISTTIDDK